MNSTVSENQTFASCIDSNPGFSLQFSVIALDLIVLLPIQICVLWLGTNNIRVRGRLATSEIFTMNLSALEFFAIIIDCLNTISDFTFNNDYTILLALFFSGSYPVGRPFMNSLICVERYMAVAHPAIYRNPAFVKHRYIGAGLVWMLILAYGVAIAAYQLQAIEVYYVSLTISLSVITACSLGVLKILLRPSPGETQKEGMGRQKKRAFVIITGILLCISVPYGLDILIMKIINDISHDVFCALVGMNMWLLQLGSSTQPLLYLSKRGMFSCIIKALIKTTRNVEATSS